MRTIILILLVVWGEAAQATRAITVKAERQPKIDVSIVPYIEVTEYRVTAKLVESLGISMCFGEVTAPPESVGHFAIWALPEDRICKGKIFARDTFALLAPGSYAGSSFRDPDTRVLSARYFVHQPSVGVPIGEIYWSSDARSHEVRFNLIELCSGKYENRCRVRKDGNGDLRVEISD